MGEEKSSNKTEKGLQVREKSKTKRVWTSGKSSFKKIVLRREKLTGSNKY